jgi:two-component system response regulator AlgR
VIKVLIVDDEPLARARLRRLLADCADPPTQVVAEAGNAAQALAALTHHEVDLALVDIHMPGADGLALSRAVREQGHRTALVFVTAHAEHALQAFEADAVDYLTKPVRAERLAAALMKVARQLPPRPVGTLAPAAAEALLIHDRGRIERVPLAEVLVLKAELKYVTVRTAHRSLILDGSLTELEAKYPALFVRAHRNALVARHALRRLERRQDGQDGEGWWLWLAGLDEPQPVSRRQLTAVREALGAD